MADVGRGADIFVDNVAGDDRATGHQSHHVPDGSGPIQTIGKALHRAQGGDAIVLANTQRPYRESISLVGSCHSGTAQEPFTLRGNGAILDGSAPVPPAAWENYAGPVFRFRPPHLGCQQLFLDDRPATRVFVARTAGGPPDLRPRQWCLLDGQIYFCVDSTKLPRDYRLRYAHNQTGITLYHVEHVLIADLVVQAFQIDGISLHNSARDVSLAGVTCRGNGRSGVTVGGASLADIDHTLLSDNGQAQLLTLPYSETHARHSRLLGYTAPGWVDQGGRVYLDGKRVESGLDQFPPTPSLEKQPWRETVGRPMEILLVEDDLEDAGLTIEALRRGQVPCRISLVRDGEEALEFLHRVGKYRRVPLPDLILLDLHLPKKSGREVLAEVRADQRLVRAGRRSHQFPRSPGNSRGRGPARGKLSHEAGRLAAVR